MTDRVLERVAGPISLDMYGTLMETMKDKYPGVNLAMRPSDDPKYIFEIVASEHEFPDVEPEWGMTMTRFFVEDSGLTVSLAMEDQEEFNEGLKLQAAVWIEALRRSGGMNYCEFEFTIHGDQAPWHTEAFTVMIQRKDHPTPIDHRNEAMERIEELEAELAALKG